MTENAPSSQQVKEDILSAVKGPDYAAIDRLLQNPEYTPDALLEELLSHKSQTINPQSLEYLYQHGAKMEILQPLPQNASEVLDVILAHMPQEKHEELLYRMAWNAVNDIKNGTERDTNYISHHGPQSLKALSALMERGAPVDSNVFNQLLTPDMEALEIIINSTASFSAPSWLTTKNKEGKTIQDLLRETKNNRIQDFAETKKILETIEPVFNPASSPVNFENLKTNLEKLRAATGLNWTQTEAGAPITLTLPEKDWNIVEEKLKSRSPKLFNYAEEIQGNTIKVRVPEKSLELTDETTFIDLANDFKPAVPLLANQLPKAPGLK